MEGFPHSIVKGGLFVTTDHVRLILSQYTRLCALEGTYAAIHTYSTDSPESKMVYRKLAVIQAWLMLLYEEERFVITQHLFEGFTWPMVVKNYETRWGVQDGKAERTLKRYQRTSLQKIADFIDTNGIEPDILSLFRDELRMAQDRHESGPVLSLL